MISRSIAVDHSHLGGGVESPLQAGAPVVNRPRRGFVANQRSGEGRRAIHPESSRMSAFTQAWVDHGCPERMRILVRGTGEVITLVEGFPVTDNAGKNALLKHGCKPQKRPMVTTLPVTDNRAIPGQIKRICACCTEEFYASRVDAQYCSPRCRQRAKRKEGTLRTCSQRERLLAGLAGQGN